MTKREIARPIPGSKRFDVVAIGNAIVDVLAHAPEEFIGKYELAKGHMQLIDRDRAHQLYDAMESATEMSGGSAANTAVGVAALGGSAAFIGAVDDDQLGEIFRHDLRSTGVHYEVPALASDHDTGRSLIVITPDGQRTMNTYLGTGSLLSEDQIDAELIANSAVVFIEGYLLDLERGEAMCKQLLSLAHENDCLVSLTLADPFVVDKYRSILESAFDTGVDILLINNHELETLYPNTPFDECVNLVKELCPYVAITCGAEGSIVCDNGEVFSVPVYPAQLIDSTGAGDLYAAGFLYGFTQGKPIEICGHYGSAAAAEVISHVGARPYDELTEFVAKALASNPALSEA